MPAAKMCDTNCVLLPAGREAFLLTTQFCFKRPFRKHTHFTVCMRSDNNYFTTALPPKMALKVPGSSSNKLSSGWLSLWIFFPQASKTSFTFPSISTEGARWALHLSDARSFLLWLCLVEINNLCSALLLSSQDHQLQLPWLCVDTQPPPPKFQSHIAVSMRASACCLYPSTRTKDDPHFGFRNISSTSVRALQLDFWDSWNESH